MKLKKLVWWLPLVALLIGCGGKPTAQELAEIDSLLWAEKNDSAYQIISSYDGRPRLLQSADDPCCRRVVPLARVRLAD